MASWTRIAIVLIAAALLAGPVRSLFLDDEDRIRGLIAHAEDGWNDASARRTVAPLAEDFRLAPFGMGKPTLRTYLFNIYRHNRDPGTDDFLYRAAVDWDRVELSFVDAERTRAHVRGRLRIERTDDPDVWNYDGEFRIIVAKSEGEWRIAAAALEGLGAPRRPPREAKRPEPPGGTGRSGAAPESAAPANAESASPADPPPATDAPAEPRRGG